MRSLVAGRDANAEAPEPAAAQDRADLDVLDAHVARHQRDRDRE